MNNSENHLAGKLLLATPSMGDPRFNKAAILICAHDKKGAMGLVVNQVLPGIEMAKLLSQLELNISDKVKEISARTQVMSGGPVDTGRGFIVHSNEFIQIDTVKIDNQISVTGTVDALKAIAEGKGPQKMKFILGYAGWDAGQLDAELQQNTWLIADATPDLVFNNNPETIWDTAITNMGIHPAMLSATIGRA